MVDRLQDEQIRAARGRVFELQGKPLEQWTPDDIAMAERVCYSYDVAGIMVRYKVLPKQLIVDNWEASLRTLWTICRPLAEKYRNERDAPNFWDNFEWLASEAEIFARREERKHLRNRC